MRESIINYICSWENKGYKNGIPDQAPIRLEQLKKVPSYRQICKALLSNDLKTLGVMKKKPKSYHDLKKIELGIVEIQLKLRL